MQKYDSLVLIISFRTRSIEVDAQVAAFVDALLSLPPCHAVVPQTHNSPTTTPTTTPTEGPTTPTEGPTRFVRPYPCRSALQLCVKAPVLPPLSETQQLAGAGPTDPTE